MGVPTAFSKLQQECTWLHGPGERKHIDLGGASRRQDAGASIRRRASSDHIVDDDDALARKLGARQHDFAGVVGERHPEPRADGRSDEVEPGPAGAAEDPMGEGLLAAGDADRRQQEICEGR
jgi:hypothetical protein